MMLSLHSRALRYCDNNTTPLVVQLRIYQHQRSNGSLATALVIQFRRLAIDSVSCFNSTIQIHKPQGTRCSKKLAAFTILHLSSDKQRLDEASSHHGSNHSRSSQAQPACRTPNTKVYRLVLAHRALATAAWTSVDKRSAVHRGCRDHRKWYHRNQYCSPYFEERWWQRGKPVIWFSRCRDARSTRSMLGSGW